MRDVDKIKDASEFVSMFDRPSKSAERLVSKKMMGEGAPLGFTEGAEVYKEDRVAYQPVADLLNSLHYKHFGITWDELWSKLVPFAKARISRRLSERLNELDNLNPLEYEVLYNGREDYLFWKFNPTDEVIRPAIWDIFSVRPDLERLYDVIREEVPDYVELVRSDLDPEEANRHLSTQEIIETYNKLEDTK